MPIKHFDSHQLDGLIFLFISNQISREYPLDHLGLSFVSEQAYKMHSQIVATKMGDKLPQEMLNCVEQAYLLHSQLFIELGDKLPQYWKYGNYIPVYIGKESQNRIYAARGLDAHLRFGKYFYLHLSPNPNV